MNQKAQVNMYCYHPGHWILPKSWRGKMSGYCWILCSTMCPKLHWDDVRKYYIFSQLWNELWGASALQPELLKQLFWLIHCCPARKHRCFAFEVGFVLFCFFKCRVSGLHWPSLSHSLQNLNSKSPICWEISEEFNLLLFSLLKTDKRKSYSAQASIKYMVARVNFCLTCLEGSTVLFNHFLPIQLFSGR